VNTKTSDRLPVYSIALLSATAIAYEILLVRLFAIIQWHHYAYMVISLALLGYGASGTFLAFSLKPLIANFRISLLINMTLFGLSTLLCFLVAQEIAFVPDAVAYDIGQWVNLTGMYLLLSVPFFFAANAIGLTLAQAGERLSWVYAADLLGAGIGSLLIVLLLFAIFPHEALQLLAVVGLLSALLAAWETGLRTKAVGLLLLGAVLLASLPTHWLNLSASPYKDLSQALRITGNTVIEQDSSPLGLISVVDSQTIPLRHAPGLSLNAMTEPPQQRGLFIDGNGPSAMNQVTGNPGSLDFLGQVTSALPYHVIQPRQVLIPGSGAGTDVLQALQLSNASIDAVEINPQIIELLQGKYRGYTNELYNNPRVTVFNAEGRGYLHRHTGSYDLIQLPLMDSFNASSSGLLTLSEDYLYTVETFKLYLQHLSPGGILAINRWIKIPPRDTLKVVATAIAALQQLGIKDSHNRLALLRGWQTSILLVKNASFSKDELGTIRQFSQQRSFDLAYLPDMKPGEANRFNRLSKPYFYQASMQLLGPARQEFLERYKFNLQPATNDQPYFFHFFRWQSLPEILKLYGRGGVPLIDTGYLVMIATLVQAVIASILLVLLPLYFLKRQARQSRQETGMGRVFSYFGSLGLAFLFIEIAFIQKLTLFLHHPLYAVAVSLAAFLLFAGLGSYWSQRLSGKMGKHGIQWIIGIIIVLCLLYLAGLDMIFDRLIQLPDMARILVSLLIIAPLAFFLGMPFPIGMTRLAEEAPLWLPWAWGINGCASVISAVLATLIALHTGFSNVVLIAACLYFIALLSFPATSAS
jgi:spermidine synthase